MLGKRVLSPSHHSPHAAPASNNNHSAIGAATAATQNHLDFGGLSKKRQRLGGQDSQGMFDRCGAGAGVGESNVAQRSLSPPRAGSKRNRTLSYLQPSALPSPSSNALYSPASGGAVVQNGLFGFAGSSKQHTSSSAGKDRAEQEMVELRREVVALRAHTAEKEVGLTLAKEENARLRDGVGMLQKEMERLTSDNRILKRAVGIQNTKGKELESQLHNMQQATGQAAEYIKRLEQTNYALSVRVQAMGNSGPSDFLGGQRPPDVY